MVFRTIAELKSYLLSHSKSAVERVTGQVYQVIDRFVKEFYAGFTPEMYDRTYQLYSSLVKSDIEPTGNGWEAVVYFDYSSLVYTTGASPSGQQVTSAAAHGGHGADGLCVINGSTGIWDEPMSILSTEAYEMLKRMLIAEGIPIR